ncbi:hypothetical protein B5P46_00470 [Rhizobium leguminosarum]|uniref:Uncharacterized protein n=1 Tax=Rhizobium leguminosarum TaxID=384 RepID=A0A4Q1UE98_RHILE|nr:hypothetical protein B5P46_00470 [Rhizobium leguminosarum]
MGKHLYSQWPFSAAWQRTVLISAWGRGHGASVEILQQSAQRKIQAIGGEFSAQLGAVAQIAIRQMPNRKQTLSGNATDCPVGPPGATLRYPPILRAEG